MWTLLILAVASAGQLAGVNMADTVTVADSALLLNGMGLREKYFIDVYVGGLYLPARTQSERQAIDEDVAKRLEMHFVYNKVSQAQLVESFEEGLRQVPNGVAQAAAFRTLYPMLGDVVSGDRIVFDYIPGTGTTVTWKGTSRGTVGGVDFMRALWAIYLGAAPPTAKLKRGMLGQ